MIILCFEAGGGIELRMINISILRAILRVKDLRYRQEPGSERGGSGPGTTDPQEMLIFWELLIFRIINVGFIFLVTRKSLTYHAAITDGIAAL